MVIHHTADLTFKRGGDTCRIRCDIHPRTTYKDVSGIKYHDLDPDGDHYTAEVKTRNGYWDTIHLYTKTVCDKTGRRRIIENKDIRPNPKIWKGRTSYVNKRRLHLAGSRQVKVDY